MKHSEKTKRKISKNNARYWLGKGMSGMSGKKQSNYQKRRASETHKGKKLSKETKKKIRKARARQIITDETKRKMSKTHKKLKSYKRLPIMKGRINPRWKGGITPLNKKIRQSKEYKLWKATIFKRDNYMCVFCGTKENLHIDHIKPFVNYPELRFAIDNGRTLCRRCHYKITWRK